MTDEDLKMYRHSMSHVLAKAMTKIYKDVKLAIGPSIDDGFYYDFDVTTTLTPDDAEKIESEMKKIAHLCKLAATDFENSADYIRAEVSKMCKQFPIYAE